MLYTLQVQDWTITSDLRHWSWWIAPPKREEPCVPGRMMEDLWRGQRGGRALNDVWVDSWLSFQEKDRSNQHWNNHPRKSLEKTWSSKGANKTSCKLLAVSHNLPLRWALASPFWPHLSTTSYETFTPAHLKMIPIPLVHVIGAQLVIFHVVCWTSPYSPSLPSMCLGSDSQCISSTTPGIAPRANLHHPTLKRWWDCQIASWCFIGAETKKYTPKN